MSLSKLDAKNLWENALSLIQKELDDKSFSMWFHPTKALELRDDELCIGVPNKIYEECLSERFSKLISAALKSLVNQEIKVRFSSSDSRQSSPQVVPHEAAASKDSIGPGNRLNPRYSFESFVVGSSNRFAHAASLAVAESPAKAYNPLFIYGGVGLGKTHLMQAIGNHITGKWPGLKVYYISSERFTNQLIASIQHHSTSKFRERYRTVDALLIDDIHFIAGKESTQEEFFHTFNALYDAHKQIIVTSDRPPKEIPMLEERLVSRFQWGLVTDIQAPDLETRIAILRKKAARESVTVPDDIIVFLAERIKSNVRELEGALIRIVAYSSLVGSEISIELIKDVLKDLLRDTEKKVTVELIQKVVAEYFNVRAIDMTSKNRSRSVAYPRQVAMFLARQLTEHSLPEIGEAFGGRDHSTVIHACAKISCELSENNNVKELIGRLTEKLKC